MSDDNSSRDKLASEYVAGGYGCDGDTSFDSFTKNWDAARANTQSILLETKKGSYTVNFAPIMSSLTVEVQRLGTIITERHQQVTELKAPISN